jgi:hypothetical protein
VVRLPRLDGRFTNRRQTRERIRIVAQQNKQQRTEQGRTWMCSPMGLSTWFRRFDEHVEGEIDGGRWYVKSRAAARGSSESMVLRLWAAWLHTNE